MVELVSCIGGQVRQTQDRSAVGFLYKQELMRMSGIVSSYKEGLSRRAVHLGNSIPECCHQDQTHADACDIALQASDFMS